MGKPFIITFAGVPGSGKTPMAFHISYTFRLPIIQMDAIRLEVREDLLIADNTDPHARKEFLRRASTRYQKLLREDACFIDDSSVDRSWKQAEDDQYFKLYDHDYDYLIISMDLSRAFMQKLHAANQSLSHDRLDEYYQEHQTFLEQYSDDIGLHIIDDTFADRMTLCETAVSQFIYAHHEPKPEQAEE
jgi:hypothetical protein